MTLFDQLKADRLAAMKARDDLAKNLLGTLVAAAGKAILEGYLPTLLDEDATRAAVAAVVAGLPERSPRQMGKVMAELKARHGSAIDLKRANAMVKSALDG
jgi:uncharacterized protein YqeY